MKKYLTPSDRYYTKTHEWVMIKNDVALVGITDYAQDMLHDIIYCSLPSVNTIVKAGDVIAEIESVKSVAEVYAPVSGVIIEVNVNLEKSPELINKSPYDEGWIVKIKMNKPEELGNLLNSEEYSELIRSLIE
ncbi:MAG: glycine cleavage system protein GcvH [Candidatus Geothermarchaeota archaeon]